MSGLFTHALTEQLLHAWVIDLEMCSMYILATIKIFFCAVSPLQVQDTNNSCIVSKLSTCKAGYFFDEHLKHFVQKPARRAPLIHR